MLRLFGPHRIDGVAGAALPRQAFLLAAQLDLAPAGRLSRAAVAAFLWEGAAGPQANGNLRQLLLRIRRWEAKSGLSLVQADATHLSRGDGTLASDLPEFLGVTEATTEAALRRVLDLVSGDLLADMQDGPEDVAVWLEEQRTLLNDRFSRIVLDAVRRVGGEVADTALSRLEASSPFDDGIARARMIAAARQNRGEVNKVYARFKARVADELDGMPEPATNRLLSELTSNGPEPAAPSGAGAPRVLILPPPGGMTEMSRSHAMLGVSLIDEVTNTLARTRTFAVFAPHTARQLSVSAFPGGNPYGADYLVATRLVPTVDSRLRLSVALTNLVTHEVLLGDEMRFEPGALGGHHFALASALAGKLATAIGSSERVAYERHGHPSAFVHYLLGAEILGTFSLQNVRRARSHFQRALRLSPNFSPARSLLARSLALEWLLLERHDMALIDASLVHAKEALAADPLDPMAHREVGHALLYLDRLDEAVQSFESGVNLGPHHADVLFHYADGLSHAGKMREARKSMDLALALNPLAPDFYHWVGATTDYFLGNYAAAAIGLAKLKEPEPAARVIAIVEAMNGNLPRAHKYRDIFMRNHPEFRLADYQIPQRRKEDRDHWRDGMKRAGFS